MRPKSNPPAPPLILALKLNPNPTIRLSLAPHGLKTGHKTPNDPDLESGIPEHSSDDKANPTENGKIGEGLSFNDLTDSGIPDSSSSPAGASELLFLESLCADFGLTCELKRKVPLLSHFSDAAYALRLEA